MAKHCQGSGISGSLLFRLNNVGLRKKGTNLLFVQMITHGKFAFDIFYECTDKISCTDIGAIDTIVSHLHKEFNAQFETSLNISGLVSSNPKPEYGQEDSSEAKLSELYSLFATTPSQSFFPCGFLWDEGFHQLVLWQWDLDLSLEIICSWFGTMDSNGWMAHKQILGNEARSKVPQEFQVQYPDFANLPTILFAVEAMAEQLLA
ncbi:Processing alpha glucosidase I [Coemansia sp. RSA 455]|nr:Processing alpha glucosidase I [Coemansia sp. RSA 455]